MIAALLAAPVFAGCDEDDPAKPGPAGGPIAATVPDLVVSNLEWAWENRSFVEYEKLIDTGFVFFFSESEGGGLAGATWDAAAELAAVANMFAGLPGSNGAVISSLALTLTPQSPTWDDEVPAEFAGTLGRSYDANMVVGFADGSTVLVRGVQEFYVLPVDVDGTTLYRLRYWRDQGIPMKALADATVSWGYLQGGLLGGG